MPIVADSYGAPQEAGGPAQVAGAGVSDVVIATDGMLRGHRDWAGGCAAHDTVSTVGLVRHTSMSTWTHHLRARLLALSLVHDLQVRMSHATGHKQSTLLLIGPSIAAAHSVLE